MIAELFRRANGGVALFYFSGFGLQVGRRSYLVPVNAQIWSEADVGREGVSVDDLQGAAADRAGRSEDGNALHGETTINAAAFAS